MAIINPPVGGAARSIHVQQIINWLRGLPSYSEAVSFTGITSTSGYALTVANRGATGLAFRVQNAARTKDVFEVNESGTIVRANASTGTYLRVRNFANDADLFAVTETGISFGGVTVATLTGTETLTNKTLTAPVINSGRIGDFLDVTQTTAPANPSTNRLRVYALTGSDSLKFRNNSGTEQTLADLDSAQTFTNKTLSTPSIAGDIHTTHSEYVNGSTPSAPAAGRIRVYSESGLLKQIDSSSVVKQFASLTGTETFTNKTLTAPTITSPVVSDFISLTQTSAPSSPSAGSLRLYILTAETVLKHKDSTGTIRELVDTNSVQTLSNKTISGGSYSGITLNNPIVSNYGEFAWSSNPGGTANTTRIWAKNDNNVYGTLPGGTQFTFLTSSNTSLSTSLSFARPLMLGGL